MRISQALLKRTLILLGTLVLLCMAVACAYWWANTPPRHPRSVSVNGVFIWGASVGLPSPKRGNWVECWFDNKNNLDMCRFTDMKGSVYYEGVFSPDDGEKPLHQSELKIRSRLTSDWSPIVSVGNTFVPILCLRNGRVLIPKDGYAEGKRKLDQLRQLRQIRAQNGLETP